MLPDPDGHTRRVSQAQLYRRLLSECRFARPWLFFVWGFAALSAPLSLLAPVPLSLAIDLVVNRTAPEEGPGAIFLAVTGPLEDASVIFLCALSAAVIAVAVSAHATAEWLLREKVAERLTRRFRVRLVGAGLRFRHSEVSALGKQEIAHRVLKDSHGLHLATVHGLFPMSHALLWLGGMLAVVAAIDPLLALLSTGVAVPAFALIRLSQRRLRKGWRDVAAGEVNLDRHVRESVLLQRIIRSCGSIAPRVGGFESLSHSVWRSKLRVLSRMGIIGMSLGLATGVGTGAALYVGFIRVEEQMITLGEFLLFMAYLSQLQAPLHKLGASLASQEQALANAERAFEILDGVPSRPASHELLPSGKDLELRNVSIGYGSSAPVLSRVDVRIPAGSRVVITGESGTGKSSLFRVITGYARPDEGEVLIGGRSIEDLDQDLVSAQFALVPQTPSLFHGTIYENIAFGSATATPAMVEEAARRSEAHDFIMGLPENYQTMVSLADCTLSGGETQRICIARALVGARPFLLLDEPTSALDCQTEEALLANLSTLPRSTTVLLITHRRELARLGDVVLEVAGGRVRKIGVDDAFCNGGIGRSSAELVPA